WAQFRRAKGGVKAHVLLDHDDYLPRYVLITEAKCSDVKMAHAFPLHPGSIVAMDRGYNDYGLFGKWSAEQIYFVTRLKENAVYEVVEECAIPRTATFGLTKGSGSRASRLKRIAPACCGVWRSG